MMPELSGVAGVRGVIGAIMPGVGGYILEEEAGNMGPPVPLLDPYMLGKEGDIIED